LIADTRTVAFVVRVEVGHSHTLIHSHFRNQLNFAWFFIGGDAFDSSTMGLIFLLHIDVEIPIVKTHDITPQPLRLGSFKYALVLNYVAKDVDRHAAIASNFEHL
jgi:hypothetical protein